MAKQQEQDLIGSIYAIAMEPERFDELVAVWQETIEDNTDYTGLFAQHADRAETILSLMEENESILPQPLHEKLNAESQAMMALTLDGIVEAQNTSAQTMFNMEEGTCLTNMPFSQKSINTLLKAIRSITDSSLNNEQSAPSLFRLEHNDNPKPLLIALSPWKTIGGRRFILLKTADFVWPDYLSPLIKKAFGLTDAETDVVKHLVEGKSYEDIAKTRGTAIDTVRVQIRSIYTKTSTNSKSEFIRMAIGLTTLQLGGKDTTSEIGQSLKRTDDRAYPFPEHRRLLSLPDGRVIDYAVFGPENGKPCLFFHNQYFGDIWPAELARTAIQNNLRILSPARPYYANSSPYPKGVIPYEQFAKDLNVLMEKLNIEKAVHISQTNGGMFSIAFANMFPKKTMAVVSIAPMLPILSTEDWEKMPKAAKFFSNIIRNHTHILKFIIMAGQAYHKRVGSRNFLETFVAHTQPDKSIIKNNNNADAIIRGFQYHSRNRVAAVYNDYKYLLDTPLQALKQLQCPFYVLIGTHDNNSREHRADRMIDEGINLQKIMAKGGGDLLFFSHPKLIVDTLVDAWQSQ